MKKVIITAANSFIGRRLCKALSDNGYYVYAVVRETFATKEVFADLKNCRLICCDMENYGNLSKLIEEECDIGITLAWNGTRGQARENADRQNNNFINSVDCIDSFIRLGCSTIMTAGSQAEYGPWNKTEKVTEMDECQPNTEYGKAKLRLFNYCEKICAENNIRLIEPRFFSLYGPDDYEGTMVVSMIKNMIDNKPCDLTRCVQLWDFLYIDDAINAIVKLLSNDKAGGIYNFGSGVSRPLKEYVEEMYTMTESGSKLNYGAVPYPPSGMVHTNPNVQKLMRDADWKPEISFSEGIKMIIDYQRAEK